jgi:glycosyltransferase involved in cell wall biosynthesis
MTLNASHGKNDPLTKVLVFVIAYNAESTIESVLKRIPEGLKPYDTKVLLIDDGSLDETASKARKFQNENPDFPFDLTILRNPKNQGYGGNIKIGMFYALEYDYDVICLIHGDGQYAPEKLPKLIKPVVDGEADVVFGSRMMEGFKALKGGMPLYKFVGNKVLSWAENKLVGCDLSEFHTGLRLYSIDTLRKIPFNLNSNDFHFDTEIIIQLMNAKCRIKEMPINTFYGDEVCHVNGMKYARDVTIQATMAYLQRWGLTYQRKYDVTRRDIKPRYTFPKLTFSDVHRLAVHSIPRNSRVLDIGSASALIGKALKEKGCRVTGLDRNPPIDTDNLDEFIRCDLDDGDIQIPYKDYDAVLLLDVIGHLHEPERFMENLHKCSTFGFETPVYISAGNIGFIVNRLQLLFGYFNYGKRGILDHSHTRLYTFASLKKLVEDSGFDVEDVQAIPAPFKVAFGDVRLARTLSAINRFLIHFSRGLFGYRVFIKAKPRPTLEQLMAEAEESADC